ncbi:hypothetical protein D3C84_898300 [compost metagenome]
MAKIVQRMIRQLVVRQNRLVVQLERTGRIFAAGGQNAMVAPRASACAEQIVDAVNTVQMRSFRPYAAVSAADYDRFAKRFARSYIDFVSNDMRL